MWLAIFKTTGTSNSIFRPVNLSFTVFVTSFYGSDFDEYIQTVLSIKGSEAKRSVVILCSGNNEILPMSSHLELTVAIIKPHAIKVPHILKGIQNIIISNGFYVVKSKQERMTNPVAELLYDEHKNKFFYGRLITLMTSGPSQMIILAKQNAISSWREIMGPTKVAKAQLTHPDTIRGKYGLTDTRNATHGSDSTESSEREMSILFPKFDFKAWYRKDEIHFRRGSVYLDRDRFEHTIKSQID